MNKKVLVTLLVSMIMISGCQKETPQVVEDDSIPQVVEDDSTPQVVEDNSTSTTPSATEVTDTKEEYPKIAYIDDVSYYGTDRICEMVPRKMPDGTIETFVEKEIMPDSYNSANFGSEYEKLEYMFLDDGQLIIHIGEEWQYFEKQS